MSVRIGIDFDNTIAGYDHVFASQAVTLGYLGSARDLTKRQIRDEIRRTRDGEQRWQHLQAVVYGRRMDEARMFPGAARFLRQCRDTDVEVFVVSHKTQFAAADRGGIDLRAAARRWLVSNRFHDPDGFSIPEGHVFFEATRSEKVERIHELGCDYFIDDLEEVFLHPAFPDGTHRILFAAGATTLPEGPFQAARSWHEILHAVFAIVS